MTDVVVVESPAKAKTINKYLGGDFRVLASFGHVRDLPPKDGSVRPEQDFAMDWEADARGEKQVGEIAKALKGARRLFLATDAGSTGLNLQHAATIVNVDLPWNPAVLEQRVARIHRIGQRRPIRVVNFVARGTIEEGMLSVLAFKRSLAAGILDGGDTEVALGGSRLTRFMKEIESVTAAVAPPFSRATDGRRRHPRCPACCEGSGRGRPPCRDRAVCT